MLKSGFSTISIFLALFAAGCSFTNTSTQIVAVNMKPADAKLIANGVEYSGSPLFMEVKRGPELLIKAYKPGYVPYTRVVGVRLSSTGKVDAWGGILILPFLGLWSPGAWELQENNIEIVMEPITLENIPVAKGSESMPYPEGSAASRNLENPAAVAAAGEKPDAKHDAVGK